jgi:ABC-2 type transport system permease protein
MLPHAVAVISPFLPTRQYGELLWGISQPGHDAVHAMFVLGYYTIAFTALAIIGYRRDEKARYA